MRVVLAGLFVLFGTGAVVSALVTIPEEEPPVWLLSLAAIVAFSVLLVLAFAIFNRAGPYVSRGGAGDSIQKLEDEGLLTSEDFEARRAFEIEEFEDEGSHYMIELHDGSVLYLNGQYLYDYEAIDDEPELSQPRSFPCTAFTIRRHKTNGYVVDVICRGETLEPECRAPHFDSQDAKQGRIPADGDVFTDRSYEDIKTERMRE